MIPHPSYSSDLAPSACYLFRSMTYVLYEQHFTSYEDIKKWVNSWLALKNEKFFRRSIQILPDRGEKVVDCDRQYIE